MVERILFVVAALAVVVVYALSGFASFVLPLLVVGLSVVDPQTATLMAVMVAVGASTLGWMCTLGMHQYDVYYQ